MYRTFKITFVDSEGRPITNSPIQDPSNEIPVLEIIVCPPNVMSGQGIRCKALVDTGADHAVVDRSLIGRAGGALLHPVANSGVSGQANTTLHDVTFFLTDSSGDQLAIHSDAVATDHAHKAYPVILGRSLFRHGTLVLDYNAGRFEFQVPY